MVTPKQLIDTLREDFSCALKTDKIIFMLNTLEKSLADKGLLASNKVYTTENLGAEALSLTGEHIGIYVYYILSREALISSDIDRLNNFSALYAKALGELPAKEGSAVSFKNIW